MSLPSGGAHRHFIGLMSGTSLDGVDGVLVAFASDGQLQLLQHASRPFADELRAELLALNTAGDNELHRAALAANALAHVYADVVRSLLTQGGMAAADIAAIGAHGQTVRHRPHEFDATGYTIQLNNPALLAELSGVSVVADFRTRDLAAGGQGAPLVPAFHRGVFGRDDRTVAVLNLGGIANLSVLRADGGVLGFDCGPANALMDYWCHRHTGQWYDAGGAWAAQGSIDARLLAAMLREPFLDLQPPKSTGRDLFNPSWLEQHLALQPDAPIQAKDVQATLAELTALACANDVKRHAADAKTLIVCGGGALNHFLMGRIAAHLPGVQVESSQSHGIDPQQVEAAAFAWLARQCLLGLPGNLASVTGAAGPRILGAIHPA